MPDKLPYQVGITGGIGSGKSVVARIFSLLGVPVYESDYEAKKLYLVPGIREQVKVLLGPESYLANEKPNTGYIASLVFSDSALRDRLNGILYPALAKEYKNWLENQSHPYVLKVAALLFEAGIAQELDQIVLVLSPENDRLKRLQVRDSFRPLDQFRKIMANQWTDEQKIPLAGYLIRNDEKHSLIRQVVDLHQTILRQSRLSH